MNEHLRQLDLDAYRRKLDKRAAEVTNQLLPLLPTTPADKVKQFALLAVSLFDNTEAAPATKLDARRNDIQRLKRRATELVKDAANTTFARIHRGEWARRSELASTMGIPQDLDGPALKEIHAAEKLGSARAAMILAVGRYLSTLEEMEKLTPPPKKTGRRAISALEQVAALWWQTFGSPPTTSADGAFFAAAAALLHSDDPSWTVRRAVAAVLELGPPGPQPPSGTPPSPD